MTAPPRLLLITDLDLADPSAHLRRLARALVVGEPRRVAVGLRDHGRDARARLEFGRRLRELTARAGASLLVFDRVDLALALDAEGVHLGRRSMGVADARALIGAGRTVSCSCHDARELDEAARADVDYATLSPLRASPGKGAPLGVVAFRALRARLARPVIALGGIDAGSLADARAAGADGVAVIRAVFGVDEPRPFVEAVFRAFA